MKIFQSSVSFFMQLDFGKWRCRNFRVKTLWRAKAKSCLQPRSKNQFFEKKLNLKNWATNFGNISFPETFIFKNAPVVSGTPWIDHPRDNFLWSSYGRSSVREGCSCLKMELSKWSLDRSKNLVSYFWSHRSKLQFFFSVQLFSNFWRSWGFCFLSKVKRRTLTQKTETNVILSKRTR